MQKKKNEVEALYGELGHAFNFTKGDLEANRTGFLSDRQRFFVKRSFRQPFLYLAILLILAPLPFILMYFFSNLTLPIIIASGVVAVTAFGALLLDPRLDFAKNASDFKNGKLERVQGQVEVIHTNRIRIAGKEFKLSKGQGAYDFGETIYRVYYLPNSDFILSIEALKD